ncbi:MAG: AAA family ATPase [Myxococcota bacterium]
MSSLTPAGADPIRSSVGGTRANDQHGASERPSSAAMNSYGPWGHSSADLLQTLSKIGNTTSSGFGADSAVFERLRDDLNALGRHLASVDVASELLPWGMLIDASSAASEHAIERACSALESLARNPAARDVVTRLEAALRTCPHPVAKSLWASLLRHGGVTLKSAERIATDDDPSLRLLGLRALHALAQRGEYLEPAKTESIVESALSSDNVDVARLAVELAGHSKMPPEALARIADHAGVAMNGTTSEGRAYAAIPASKVAALLQRAEAGSTALKLFVQRGFGSESSAEQHLQMVGACVQLAGDEAQLREFWQYGLDNYPESVGQMIITAATAELSSDFTEWLLGEAKAFARDPRAYRDARNLPVGDEEHDWKTHSQGVYDSIFCAAARGADDLFPEMKTLLHEGYRPSSQHFGTLQGLWGRDAEVDEVLLGHIEQLLTGPESDPNKFDAPYRALSTVCQGTDEQSDARLTRLLKLSGIHPDSERQLSEESDRRTMMRTLSAMSAEEREGALLVALDDPERRRLVPSLVGTGELPGPASQRVLEAALKRLGSDATFAIKTVSALSRTVAGDESVAADGVRSLLALRNARIDSILLNDSRLTHHVPTDRLRAFASGSDADLSIPALLQLAERGDEETIRLEVERLDEALTAIDPFQGDGKEIDRRLVIAARLVVHAPLPLATRVALNQRLCGSGRPELITESLENLARVPFAEASEYYRLLQPETLLNAFDIDPEQFEEAIEAMSPAGQRRVFELHDAAGEAVGASRADVEVAMPVASTAAEPKISESTLVALKRASEGDRADFSATLSELAKTLPPAQVGVLLDYGRALEAGDESLEAIAALRLKTATNERPETVTVADYPLPTHPGPVVEALVPRGAKLVDSPSAVRNREAIAHAFFTNTPLWIEGPTSGGKTAAVREVCELTGTPFRRVNLNPFTCVEDLFGMEWPDPKNPTKMVFVKGPVIEAAERGEVVCLDELDNGPPEVSVALHPLLDFRKQIHFPGYNDGEPFRPHSHFRVFATGNGVSMTGRTRPNAAFRSRFRVHTAWALDDNDVRIIAEQKYGGSIPTALLASLVPFHMEMHEGSENGDFNCAGVDYSFTLRTFFRACDSFLRYRQLDPDGTPNAKRDQIIMRREIQEQYLDGLIDPEARDAVIHSINSFFDKATEHEARASIGLKENPDAPGTYLIERVEGGWRIGDAFIEELNIGEAHMIPGKDAIVTERVALALYKWAKAKERGDPLLVISDPGAGKTRLVHFLAKMAQQHLYEFPSMPNTDATELVSQPLPGGSVRRGPLANAIEHRGILYWDEINVCLPTVPEVANPVLDGEKFFIVTGEGTRLEVDEGTGLEYQAQPVLTIPDEFFFVATMNPSDLEGLNQLSRAFMNRVQVDVLDSPSPQEMKFILGATRLKAEPVLGQDIVEAAVDLLVWVRKEVDAGRLEASSDHDVFTMRHAERMVDDIRRTAEVFGENKAFVKAAVRTFSMATPEDERRVVAEASRLAGV